MPYTASAQSVDALLSQSSGNITVGSTTTPSGLTVTGNAVTDGILGVNGNNAPTQIAPLDIGYSAANGSIPAYGWLQSYPASATLALNPAGGTVGIGTEPLTTVLPTTPPSLLQVGNIYASQVNPSLSGTQTPPVSAGGNVSIQASGQILNFGLSTASPYAAWIQSLATYGRGALPFVLNPLGGNVGIGGGATLNPGATLDVNGTIRSISGSTSSVIISPSTTTPTTTVGSTGCSTTGSCAYISPVGIIFYTNGTESWGYTPTGSGATALVKTAVAQAGATTTTTTTASSAASASDSTTEQSTAIATGGDKIWGHDYSGALDKTGIVSAPVTQENAIAVTRLQAFVQTPAADCATNAVFSIVDTTDSSMIASLTIDSAKTYDSGAFSISVPAGHTLEPQITTAAAGCSQSPSALSFNVQYQ